MHSCKICNYITSSYHNLKKHYSTQKHINLTKQSTEQTNDVEPQCVNQYVCCYCKGIYSYKSNLNRHIMNCKLREQDNIATNYKQQLEIEKLKVKNLELQILYNNRNIIQNNTVNNTTNNINQNNNINLSKIQNLNLNFGDVIDINTFIENYKNQYGLTNEQTETLLDNYKNGGINSCISSLVYYLKESAIQQYKQIKGKEIARTDIILPFILTDQSMRSHFEKNNNGQWDKTIVIDNIRKIVGITDDHIYKHHNTHLQLNDQHKRQLINGVLKASDYSKLNILSKPDLYKIKDPFLDALNLETLKI